MLEDDGRGLGLAAGGDRDGYGCEGIAVAEAADVEVDWACGLG
jgi:hypothetical protein